MNNHGNRTNDTDDRLHVCHVIDTLGVGGAENLLLDLVGLSPDDVEFTVCYRKGDGSRRSAFESAGADVVDLDFSVQYDPLGVARLAALCRRRSVDVVHNHLPASMVSGRLAAAVVGTPTVSTHHNLRENYQLPSRVLERATRWLDDETVAVSRGVKESFGRRAAERWTTVYNGIDADVFQRRVDDSDPAPIREEYDLSDGPTYLWIGRYVNQKAPGDLVEAFETVLKAEPSATLVMVGTGELLADVEATIERRGLTDDVVPTGYVERVEPFYALADAFVSASFREGLPITFLEAMAVGLPIVATDIPGVDECVDDGRTGILVPPGRPGDFGRAMVEVLDADRRVELGSAGAEYVRDRFSLARTFDEYEAIYRRLTATDP